jgi:hypothetical protein
MKNKFITATLLILILTSLSSCFASRSKVGCPATAESSGRRFKG